MPTLPSLRASGGDGADPGRDEVASLTFESVTKRFDDVVAVDALDLEIHDGEFMVLLGPSGCGKTTALRMIAGLEEITEGRLYIGDRVVNDVDPARRDVSMVFQSYALYPHMTVRRNIESPLLVRKYRVDGDGAPPRKLTKAERAARVDEAARVLGLTELLDRKPAALSGGQRQRVALARAFVGRPQAYLMDEPLSNLDAKLRAATRLELVDLHRRVQTTVVYVTHDQVEAMTMADRIAIMSAGRLQQVGTPQEVYDRPANLFVAQFIGTPPMNTLTGTVTTDGGTGPAVDVGHGRVPLPPGLTTRLEEGRPVVVGVRPEHLALSDEGPLEQKVRAVEWLGHECLVFGAIGDSPLVVRQTGLARLEPGGTARLVVDPAHVHVFDPETTERLP
ncbi:MAG: ABC transporter ATP-binding protein [Thermoanaerobacterales bacterium]|jgi:multiple sugar transport system ATP-binding protein